MAPLRSCVASLCLSMALVPGGGARAQGTAPDSPLAGHAPPRPVVPPAPAPIVSPPTVPPDTDGDRADAIARDMVLHPPLRPGSQPGSAQLRTASLRLGGLLDRSVHGSENTEVGRVIDVLVGEDGRPAALELDVGGFMGVGNRRIAVAWSLFDVPKPPGEPLRVALSEGQVKSAPAAEDSGAVTVVTGDGAVAPAEDHPKGEPPAAAHGPALTAIPDRAAQPALPPAIPALGLAPPPSMPMPPVPTDTAAPRPPRSPVSPSGQR